MRPSSPATLLDDHLWWRGAFNTRWEGLLQIGRTLSTQMILQEVRRLLDGKRLAAGFLLHVGQSPPTMDTLVRIGRTIYPYRGAFGVPLMVAVLLLYRPSPYPEASCEYLRSLVGWAVLILGLTWRVWGVACWFTRDREGVIGGKRLMMVDGPYAYTRNPRYFGNLLMGVGAASLVGQVWVVVFVTVLWLLVHVPIMAAERETLRERFGSVYDAYCDRVPMFWPRFAPSRALGGQWWPVSWAQGVREEMGTIMGWLCLGLFVEGWRVAHLADTWRGWGPQWKFFVLIPVVVALCEAARSLLPRERFTDEDRPMAP